VTTATESTTQLADDLVDVRRKLEQLAAEGRVDTLIAMVVDLLARMRDSHNALAMRLANALRELYGRKSQKVTAEQLTSLLKALDKDAPAGAEAAANGTPPAGAESSRASENGSVPQPPEPPKPPRGRGGRAPLPTNLPRRPR
jgi:transposase